MCYGTVFKYSCEHTYTYPIHLCGKCQNPYSCFDPVQLEKLCEGCQIQWDRLDKLKRNFEVMEKDTADKVEKVAEAEKTQKDKDSAANEPNEDLGPLIPPTVTVKMKKYGESEYISLELYIPLRMTMSRNKTSSFWACRGNEEYWTKMGCMNRFKKILADVGVSKSELTSMLQSLKKSAEEECQDAVDELFNGVEAFEGLLQLDGITFEREDNSVVSSPKQNIMREKERTVTMEEIAVDKEYFDDSDDSGLNTPAPLPALE